MAEKAAPQDYCEERADRRFAFSSLDLVVFPEPCVLRIFVARARLRRRHAGRKFLIKVENLTSKGLRDIIDIEISCTNKPEKCSPPRQKSIFLPFCLFAFLPCCVWDNPCLYSEFFVPEYLLCICMVCEQYSIRAAIKGAVL